MTQLSQQYQSSWAQSQSTNAFADDTQLYLKQDSVTNSITSLWAGPNDIKAVKLNKQNLFDLLLWKYAILKYLTSYLFYFHFTVVFYHRNSKAKGPRDTEDLCCLDKCESGSVLLIDDCFNI